MNKTDTGASANRLVERMLECTALTPERTALLSDGEGEAITFSGLTERTGRIYAALKRRHIGREDMILICLPRGVRVYVCVMGILRAGAAFTILEDTAPTERKARIEKDAGCRLVIDARMYDEMMSVELLDGAACPDPHDACYAVYTSGSTGVPKGVLHEYGQIGLYLASAPAICMQGKANEVCAIVSPLNFIASLLVFFSAMEAGACTLVADYRSIMDPAEFCAFLRRNGVTHTFITPSLLKILPDIPECVRQIFIGGEPAYDVYREGPEIINIFSCSEAGFDIAVYTVDRPCRRTPAGKNRCGIPIRLLDEDGKDADCGEICIPALYCRGYIGAAALNKKAFRNGLYHTGDEGYFAEDGNLIVCGRKDDMVKIRGNRVEPGEAEAVLRQVLHTGTAVVKGFNTNGREFLAAYIPESARPKSVDALKRELGKYLPDYMIPAYFVCLPVFPLLPSGKIDKKALAAPETVSDAGERPADETEAYLCRLFAKALTMKNVGPHDDFFALGGDSLTAMRMVMECSLKQISVRDLYELRTPARMAERFRVTRVSDDELEIGRKRALTKTHPVFLETLLVFDCQKYAPHSTMWNLSFLFEIKRDVIPEKLAAAVDRVLRHHPAFSSVFCYENGVLKQKYRPELFGNIPIVHTTEAEFAEIRTRLVRSYDTLTDVLLYRHAIYITEKRTLLFFDIHHSVTDGASLRLVMEQVCACCRDPETVLPEDYAYLILEDFNRRISEYRDRNNPVNRYYRELGARFLNDRTFIPPVLPDEEGDSMRRGVWNEIPDFSKNEVRRYLLQNRITENEFFCAVCLLAIAKYNGSDKSMLQFVHSGRDDAMRASSCALLLHSIALFADTGRYGSLSDMFDDVKAQEEYGTAHGDFNICYLVNEVFDLSVYFIYQKDMLRIDRYEPVQRQLEIDPPNAADSLIEFSFIDNEEEPLYKMMIAYSATNYKAGSIRTFATLFMKIAKAILAEPDPGACRTDVLLNGIASPERSEGARALARRIRQYRPQDRNIINRCAGADGKNEQA